ncbi:hypothetical protein F4781DRAFT_421483 [Annulohypoxylon bovei var. microspora]|nr:hypothetical protein F4781DRAFT_421483 [Annulohypoxylon bovei var. microspora]
MFLHSGASLHGHEYSSRPAPQPGHRRNPLLRSAFATPINRTSSYRTSTETSPSEPNSSDIRRPRPVSEHIPKASQPVVRFQEPKCDPTPPAKPEAMSEDECSIASDSDASRISSSPRRTRRRVPRKSTTFLFAHPPPKLRNKQLLIHIRPKLLLQIQQLSANRRPRPIVDVYPSSAVARSLIAPLLKRFPMIARIKRELNVQDVMLVKSEDYAQASGSESEGDEDDIKSRELLAILSPLRTEDKAEIVLADGTVWVATPRLNGTSSCSYEFVSVDSNGNTITARWVRKQVTTKSQPTTPTTGSTPPPPAVDYKFTFSIIDPNCRRHPIMATLTNSSLDILDTFTTVSQSASRYPPTSPLLATPTSTSEENPFERTTQRVEDWQKNFITISAIWVMLRHGCPPNYKSVDFNTLSACVPTPPTDTSGVARKRSLSVNTDMAPKLNASEAGCRRKFLGTPLKNDQFVSGVLPRRATSIGAAFIQKRNAAGTEGPGHASSSPEQGSKNRRPFSGDWGGTANRNVDNSLAAVLDVPLTSSPTDTSTQSNTSSSAPFPLCKGRRAVSACYSVDPGPPKPGNVEFIETPDNPRNSLFQGTLQDGQRDDQDHKTKNQKLRSFTNWFRKLQGR